VYGHANQVVAHLNYVEPDVIYSTYFGLKDEITDEDGVFDPVKARHMMLGT
jgi:hypothetical protein